MSAAALGEDKIRRVLIVGVSGYLGAALAQGLREEYDVFGTFHSRPSRIEGVTCLPVNVVNGGEILETLKRTRPDVVLYAVGMTDLKACEDDRGKAQMLHIQAATVFQKISPYAVRFVYFSVDEVFGLASPRAPRGFTETESPMPASHLGRTRASGEAASLAYGRGVMVIRTGQIYGEDLRPGLHLCTTPLSVIGERLHRGEHLTLAKDMLRSPVYVGDVVRATRKLLERFQTSSPAETYHWAGPETRTPFDFSCEAAKQLGWNAEHIRPGLSAKGKISQTVNATLDASKFEAAFDFRFQSPVEGLTEYAERLRTGKTHRWEF